MVSKLGEIDVILFLKGRLEYCKNIMSCNNILHTILYSVQSTIQPKFT
jgi:hypothetical protein